jgi:hypothetical protein
MGIYVLRRLGRFLGRFLIFEVGDDALADDFGVKVTI